MIANPRPSHHSPAYLNEVENQLGVHKRDSLTDGKEVGFAILDDLIGENAINAIGSGDDVVSMEISGNDTISVGAGDL